MVRPSSKPASAPIEICRDVPDFADIPLLPPEAFPETRPSAVERETVDGICPCETGPNSRSVRLRLTSSCCGWVEPPTAQEFYDAIRAQHPTARQSALIGTWASEATTGEIVRGWLEEAYTWPLLVAALHRTGRGHAKLNELLNGFANPRFRAAD